MQNPHEENWDEALYQELNVYFRIRIEQLLQTNAELRERQQNAETMQLEDLVSYFNEEDRERWQEFVELDRLKLQIDMWNHLHGVGSRYRPGLGFTKPDEDTSW